MSNSPFSINGISIPGSFWGRVLKYCGGDRERAARIFLRAEQKKAADPVRWISAGMVKGGYAWNACQIETDNPKAAREWIDGKIFKTGSQRIGDVMGTFFQEMSDKYNKQKEG